MLLLINSFWANCLANSSLGIILLSYWHYIWILHKLIEDLPDFTLSSLLWILCILLHSKSKFRYALLLKVSPLCLFSSFLSWQICEDWCCSSEDRLHWMLVACTSFCSYHTSPNWWDLLSLGLSFAMLALCQGACYCEKPEKEPFQSLCGCWGRCSYKWYYCISELESTAGIADDLFFVCFKICVITSLGSRL